MSQETADIAHEACLLAELERADARDDERREGRAARLAAVRYEALAAMTAEGLTPEPQTDGAALVRRFSVARVTFEAERVAGGDRVEGVVQRGLVRCEGHVAEDR